MNKTTLLYTVRLPIFYIFISCFSKVNKMSIKLQTETNLMHTHAKPGCKQGMQLSLNGISVTYWLCLPDKILL